MQKYLLFVILIFVSCSQAFIEETQDVVSMAVTVSYDTLDTGIYLEWENQWDFNRVEILRGTKESELSVFKYHLVQEKWLDEEALSGQIYYYRVQAYNSKNRIIGRSSTVKGYRAYRSVDQITVPDNLSTYEGQYTDKIQIFWAGNHEDTFRIYRSDLSDVNVDHFIKEVTFAENDELTYVDTEVTTPFAYYKVAVVGKDTTGVAVVSMSVDNIKGTTKNAPIVTASVQDISIPGMIKLEWGQDIYASYYEVYRSTVEDGEYELIAPLVTRESYQDANIPDLEGKGTGADFTYPSYYYKVKTISREGTPAFSDPAAGQATNPADILPAPKNMALVLDTSAYPYQLKISWNAPTRSGATAYKISQIDSSGHTNVIKDNFSGTIYVAPNEALNTYADFIVQAINHNAGNLSGKSSSITYLSVVPAPPVLLTVSTNTREIKATTNDVHVETHVYWWGKTGGSWWKPTYGLLSSMTGITTKEWTTKSTVGFIDLTWEQQDAPDSVGAYEIYRRKQGQAEFQKITTLDASVTSFRDDTLTSSELDEKTTGSFAEVYYEYALKAVVADDQKTGFTALPQVGSAMDPADILKASSYLTIPMHWANKYGFQETIKEGGKSPKGIEKIDGWKVTYNRMFLTWDAVPGAGGYQSLHIKDGGDSWHTRSTEDTLLEYNNEATSADMTYMYVYEDGPLAGGYTKNNSQFQVKAINKNANNIEGEARGIYFTEPDTKPY